MEYSIVNLLETKNRYDFRIDSEFYHPKFLDLAKILKKKPQILLEEAALKVSDGTHFTPTYYEKGIPFLSALNIQENELDLSNNYQYISLEAHRDLYKRCDPKANDILLRKVGVGPRWACVIPENVDEFSIFVSVAQIRCNPEKINRFFLSTFINCCYGQEQLLRFNKGISQPDLHLEDIRRLEIPELKENFQKKIERLYLLRRRAMSGVKKLYSEAEQILLSELGLLDWAQKRQLSFIKNFSDTMFANRMDAEYFQPMYDELIEKVMQYRNGYKLLNEIVSMKKCIEPGSEAYQDSGIPFVRVSNLSKFGVNNDNQQYLAESLYETLKMHQPKKGEILLSKDATPGIAYYISNEPGKIIPSSGILRLKVKYADSIYSEYLTLVLNSVVVQKQIERDIGGSVINHWLVDQVKKTLIPVLPDSIQKEISNLIAESFVKREQSKKLLDIAKRGVEMAIESSEEVAETWINQEVKAADA